MKTNLRRGLSALMAFALLLSLSVGLTTSADAADYVYNWGYRGEAATALSNAAAAFYEKNDITYQELASLEGAASTSAVPGSELYNALRNLMSQNHSYKTSYNATRELYRYTDCQGGGGQISSFYSGTPVGPDWDGGKTWNREHTWPNSKGLNGQDENDIMMLRPTSVKENSSRSNTAYGESSGYYDPNRESGGTLNLHGDVARITLYVYTRWGNTDRMWGAEGVMESREVLLRWMEEDPVDTWELGRNDAVEAITGTRNVFVDYPELAFVLFGAEIPSDMTTPSGEAKHQTGASEAPGDINGDGKVTVTDLMCLANFFAGKAQIVKANADVNGDGSVTVIDLMFLANCFAGKATLG